MYYNLCRERFFSHFFTVIYRDFVCCFTMIAYQKDYDLGHLFFFGWRLIPYSKGKREWVSSHKLHFMKCFKIEKHHSIRCHCIRKESPKGHTDIPSPEWPMKEGESVQRCQEWGGWMKGGKPSPPSAVNTIVHHFVRYPKEIFKKSLMCKPNKVGFLLRTGRKSLIS